MGVQSMTFSNIFGCDVTVTYRGAAAVCKIYRDGRAWYWSDFPLSCEGNIDKSQLESSVKRFVWNVLVDDNGKI